jgi:dynactin-2
LDTSNVDFSDKIRRSKKQGYISWSGDFELAGKDEDETLEQKYQRLNCEVRQLLDDLDKLKESGEDKTGNSSLVGLAKQTAMLQDQLAGLKMEEVLRSDPVKDIQDPRGAAKEKLIAQLEQLRKTKSGVETKSGKVGDDDVMYELMMKPDSAKLEERQRLAVFESRLEALEKTLGPNVEKMVKIIF